MKLTRLLILFACAVVGIGLLPVPAMATEMTIMSHTIPNWQGPTSGVYIEIYVDRPFVNTAGVTVQPGTPDDGRWYKRYPCTFSTTVETGATITNLVVPEIILSSTTNTTIGTKEARYSAYFVDSSGNRTPYYGFTSFSLPASFANIPPTTGTWQGIASFNTGPQRPQYDLTYYSREETNRLLAATIAASGGLATLNGLNGATQTFTNDTNVTIVSGGTAHVITWAGQLSVARGGTGAANASGARSSLGAAASGANSDITSLTGLTTALTSAQGGTGFGTSNNYTIGSILYPSTTTTLAQLVPGTSGYVLTSQGAGLPPVWAAAAGTIGGSGSSTRVTFWSGAATITSDSNFLFDSTNDRLSLGTTLATNTLNLPNAGYVGGSNAAGLAIIRAIGVNASDYVSIAQGGNRSVFGGVVTQDITGPSDFSAPDTALFHPYQNTPTAGVFATRGVYSSNGTSSNNFHLSSYVTTSGTRPTVAIFGESIALDATGTSAFGMNPVSYTIATGTTASVARGMEVNAGVLGNSTAAEAYGIIIATNGLSGAPYFTVPGTVKSYIQVQVTGGADIAAAPANGFVFNSGGGVNAIQTGGSLITVNGSTTAGFGLNLEALNASNAAFAMHNNNFVTGSSADTNYRLNAIGFTADDLLSIGHAAYQATGQTGIRFYPGSAETLRITRGAATTQPGNIGLNQSSPARQLHLTGIRKQALSGNSYVLNTGTKTVTATGSAFTSELQRGSAIEFSSEPGTTYTVATIVSDTNLTLTAFPAVNTVIGTATGDYAFALVEGSNGEDFLNYSAAHVLEMYGNSTYDDTRGMIRLSSWTTPNKRLLLGVDDASSYGYISSLQIGVGWKPLYLQAGASGSNTGGVVIGVPTASAVGAMLKVEGSGVKTANHVGSEFNNIATSVASYQKIGAQYLSVGSWIGPNVAGYFGALEAQDATNENRSNVPIFATGGKSFFGPHTNQVATPVPYTTLSPTATVDIYGTPTEVVSIGADTVQTTAPGLMTGTGTTWNTVGATDRLRPGDAVMFGTDTEVYEVGSLTSDTVMNTTGVYNGTPSGSVEAYRDPFLFRVRNSFGTERFRVESSGFTKVNGTFVQRKGTDLASAASLVLGSGNVFVVTGNTTITNIYTFSGLAADSSEAGRTIVLIWGPAVGDTFDITDGGNLKLNANVTTWDSDDTITLVYDGTNWFELYRQAN